MTLESCIFPYLSIALNLGYSLKSPRKLEKLPVPGPPLTPGVPRPQFLMPLFGVGPRPGSQGNSAAARAENRC